MHIAHNTRQMLQRFISKNEKETLEFAKKFAKKLRGGEVLLLLGDLGSGKTTFVKGLAQALRVKEKITSPTFVLLKVYKVRKVHKVKNFVHVDAYRLKTGQDLLDIGLGEWLGRPDTVVAIEWGEKIKPLLKGMRFWQVDFKHGEKESERVIEIRSINSSP